MVLSVRSDWDAKALDMGLPGVGRGDHMQGPPVLPEILLKRNALRIVESQSPTLLSCACSCSCAHSGSMPAALMIFPHLRVSSAWNLRSSSGLLVKISVPLDW